MSKKSYSDFSTEVLEKQIKSALEDIKRLQKIIRDIEHVLHCRSLVENNMFEHEDLERINTAIEVEYDGLSGKGKMWV